MNRILMTLTAAAVLGTAAPAWADTLTIRHNDLDLATPAGQKELDRRIAAAVRDFCAMDRQTTGSRVVPAQSRKCYADTMKQAKVQFAALVEGRQRGG